MEVVQTQNEPERTNTKQGNSERATVRTHEAFQTDRQTHQSHRTSGDELSNWKGFTEQRGSQTMVWMRALYNIEAAPQKPNTSISQINELIVKYIIK